MNTMKYNQEIRHAWTLMALISLAVVLVCPWPAVVVAAEDTLLAGKVTSSTGEALAGIPVRATRDNVTVSVYSNSKGEYYYPAWSQVKPGSYTLSVELPDYEHIQQ